MKFDRRALTALGAFCVAAATGLVMQNDDRIGILRQSSDGGPAVAAPETGSGASTEALETSNSAQPAVQAETADAALTAAMVLPDLPDLPRLAPTTLAADPQFASQVASAAQEMSRSDSAADRVYNAFGLECNAPELSVEPVQGPMLQVELSATCSPGEAVLIRHAGLAFSATVSPDGALRLVLPAMSSSSPVSVSFANNQHLTARPGNVVGLSDLIRIAIVGESSNAFRMRSAERMLDQNVVATPVALGNRPTAAIGGAITLLGENSEVAEVYTTEATAMPPSVMIEAVVTERTCGRELEGRLVIADRGREPRSEALSLTMPGCDALGDMVVLEYAPTDSAPLSLASNGQ